MTPRAARRLSLMGESARDRSQQGPASHASTRSEACEEALVSLASSVVAGGSQTRRRSHGVLSLALFAVVAAFVLAAMVVGAQAYGALAQSREDVSNLREGASLLLNNVRAADGADAVYVGEGPEGRSLVLMEHLDSGDFETRFYLHEGAVLQEYAVAGTPYTPERAYQVMRSGTFEFSYADGLLSVTVDSGTTEIALRCADREA